MQGFEVMVTMVVMSWSAQLTLYRPDKVLNFGIASEPVRHDLGGKVVIPKLESNLELDHVNQKEETV